MHARLALAGAGPLVEGLAAIDLVHDQAWIVETLTGFAGLRELADAVPDPPASMREPTRVVFVAGSADATPVALRGEGGVARPRHDGDR